jgi:hypothetical protein
VNELNIVGALEDLGHFLNRVHVDYVKFVVEVMEFIELVDNAVFGGVVGELETNLSVLVHLADVPDRLIDRVANRGCPWHFG